MMIKSISASTPEEVLEKFNNLRVPKKITAQKYLEIIHVPSRTKGDWVLIYAEW